MRITKRFLPLSLVSIAVLALSFSGKEKLIADIQEQYSISKLPDTWKQNASLVRDIDYILSHTVPELKRSIACMDCDAPYSVELQIDSPIILFQEIEDIGSKRHNGGYNYQCVTRFAFKSALAVYDHNGHGVARVVVSDPVTHEFTTKKKFNVYSKEGIKPTAEDYVAGNPSVTGPNKKELLDLTEKRIYRLKDEVYKLYERN